MHSHYLFCVSAYITLLKHEPTTLFIVVQNAKCKCKIQNWARSLWPQIETVAPQRELFSISRQQPPSLASKWKKHQSSSAQYKKAHSSFPAQPDKFKMQIAATPVKRGARHFAIHVRGNLARNVNKWILLRKPFKAARRFALNTKKTGSGRELMERHV